LKNLISTKSLRKLTEYLHLRLTPKRCTHQSIDMVDVSYSSPSNCPQGHRRLRFSSPLNNVKEQVSQETGKNPRRPGRPCGPSRI